MDVRGQGALEYLLLIGGAVLVAAIVIALISGMPGSVDAEAKTYCASNFSYLTCNEASVELSTQVSNVGGSAECCPLQEDGSDATTNDNFYQCLYKASGC